MGKIAAIVQARMGSTRLPGKVDMCVIDKTILGHVIDRLKQSNELDEIIVATSVKDQDKRVLEIAEEEDVNTYRGSETDVLSRYIEAAEKFGVDIVVRVTADCPLIDPVTIDELIREFLNSGEVDYMRLEGYPRGLETGMCTLETLKKVDRLVREDPKEDQYREHVTLYIYRNPEEFNIGIKKAPDEMRRDYRLCVDEKKDFELVEEIYRRLYVKGEIIDVREVLDLLDNDPKLSKINANVKQKEY